jgi:hypothetical protein
MRSIKIFPAHVFDCTKHLAKTMASSNYGPHPLELQRINPTQNPLYMPVATSWLICGLHVA